jgi:regulator of RNase E activity RraB
MTDSPDVWEFYPCRVDDAPASILLNLTYREERPSGRDTLYYAGLQILEPGDHGMGTGADVERLQRAEQAITNAAANAGFIYVGRLRTAGDWQMAFYAAAAKQDALEEIVARERGERGYRIGSKEDAAWEYYDDFLMPDAERWQWIMDRRVVEQLAEAGDQHALPRPIDHYVYFPDKAGRDAFVAAVEAQGFEAEATEETEAEPSLGAHVVRTDAVELHHIHQVAMELIELASTHGGDYDGWGCPVMKAGET